MNTNDGPLDFEAYLNNDKFNKAIDESMRRVLGLSKTTVIEGDKMDKSFHATSGSVKGFSDTTAKESKKAGSALGGIGEIASGLVGPVSALAAAYKLKELATEALEFENAFGMAMREVQTISVATQEDLTGISDAIVDMAANGPDGAIKLSKAFYQIVSAGYDGQEGLKLLEVSSKAATAGVTETAVAADGLTTVLNAWNLSSSNAGKVADVMFKTVERGKTTFGELASSIAQVAPLAAANNISFEEIFAALQTITKQGTPTTQAMTQIRSSIINMNNVLGDGWSATMTYQEGLETIAKKAGGSQTALKLLIPDVEAISGVLALTGDKAKGAADDLEATTKAVGSMEKAYGAMMTEADNKWAMVHNKWTREMRILGTSFKLGSTLFADFMNDLLMDEKADIVDPRAKVIVDAVAESISNLDTKKEKLTAIIAKINELKKSKIENILPKVYALEQEQPGLIRRSLETINAGIGMSYFTPGRTKQTELKLYNRDLEVAKQSEKELLKLFNEVSNGEGGDPFGENKKALRTLGDINKEIAAAKTAQDSATDSKSYEVIQKRIDSLEVERVAIEGAKKAEKEAIKSTVEASKEYLDLQAQILAKTKELDQANRDKDSSAGIAINAQITDLEKQLSLLENGATIAPIKAKLTVTDTKGQLKAMKQLTAEERTQLEIAASQAFARNGALEDLEQEAQLRYEVIGYALQLVDALRQGMDLTEEQNAILNSAMNTVGAIGRGDYIGAAISGITTAITSIMDTSGIEKKLTEPWIAFEEWVSRSNDVLERYIKLRDDAIGSERYTTSDNAIQQVQDFKAEAEAKLNEMQLSWTFKDSGWGGSAWTNVNNAFDDLQKKIGVGMLKQEGDIKEWGVGFYVWDKLVASYDLKQLTIDESGKFTTAKLQKLIDDGVVTDDKVIQALADYNANIEKLAAMETEKQQLLTDTMANNIADSIIEGFKNGKNAASDFASGFEDLMRDAILNSLKIKTLEEPLKLWYAQFAKDMESGGGLDEAEKNALRAQYDEIIISGKAASDAAFDAAGITDTTSSVPSASGALSAALTEDTGSELVGLWNRTALDTRSIKDYTKSSLERLVHIDTNTFNTVAELKLAVTELRQIGANTKNSGSRIS